MIHPRSCEWASGVYSFTLWRSRRISKEPKEYLHLSNIGHPKPFQSRFGGRGAPASKYEQLFRWGMIVGCATHQRARGRLEPIRPKIVPHPSVGKIRQAWPLSDLLKYQLPPLFQLLQGSRRHAKIANVHLFWRNTARKCRRCTEPRLPQGCWLFCPALLHPKPACRNAFQRWCGQLSPLLARNPA